MTDKCGRTACDSTRVFWWNWRTQAWYCQPCAWRINEATPNLCVRIPLKLEHAELVRLVREWLDADDLRNITVDPDGKVSHWGRGWTPERAALVKAVGHVSTRRIKMVAAAVRGDTEGTA